jgi:hypothetical protein
LGGDFRSKQPNTKSEVKTSKTIGPILAVVLCATGINLDSQADELDPAGATPGTPAPATVAPATVSTSTAPANNSMEGTAPDYHPFSLSPEVGTTGAGGTAAWRFSDHFGVNAGGDYFSRNLFDNRTVNGVSFSGDFKLQSENVGVRYYPSKTSSFYVGVGALFNQNQVNGSAYGKVTINGITYCLPANTPLLATYKQQPVCPEITIGGNFFYFDSAHHWAMGGELGVFYLGNPKLSLNDTSGQIPQDQLTSYQNQAISDLKKIPVWPVLKLQVTYSF